MNRRTIIVTGTAKGGTTATAGVVRILGIEFGDLGKNDRFCEDQELFRKLQHTRDIEDFKYQVAERNTKWQVWGAKMPELGKLVEVSLPIFRNPYFIFVTRDLTAMTRHRVGFESNLLRPRQFTNELRHLWRNQEWMIEFHAEHQDVPVLWVSYEKLLANTYAEVVKIADFIEVETTKESFLGCRRYVQPEAKYPEFDFNNDLHFCDAAKTVRKRG